MWGNWQSRWHQNKVLRNGGVMKGHSLIVSWKSINCHSTEFFTAWLFNMTLTASRISPLFNCFEHRCCLTLTPLYQIRGLNSAKCQQNCLCFYSFLTTSVSTVSVDLIKIFKLLAEPEVREKWRLETTKACPLLQDVAFVPFSLVKKLESASFHKSSMRQNNPHY